MKLDIVTAPEHRYFPPRSMKLFLAGGICKCVDWQQMIIDKFKNYNLSNLDLKYSYLYILNPRRTDWVEEPGATEKHIEWEFDMLERCDVFSMYFAGGESDQPICMYELGRNIERMKERFPHDWYERIFITCDKTYKRLNDVLIQVRLATNDMVKVNVADGPENSVCAHFKSMEKNLKYIYPKETNNLNLISEL